MAEVDDALKPVGVQTDEPDHTGAGVLTAANRVQFDRSRPDRLTPMVGHILDLCDFRITI